MTDNIVAVPVLQNATQKGAFHRLNPASGIQGQSQHFNKKLFYRVKRRKRTHLLLRRKKVIGDEKEAEKLLAVLKEILEILPEAGSATAHSTRIVVDKLKKLRRDVETGHDLVRGLFETIHTQRKEIEFLTEKLKAHDEALCAGIREYAVCTAFYRAAPQFNAFAHSTMETHDVVVGKVHTQEHE